MTKTDRPPEVVGERERAVQKLNEVVAERRRLREQQGPRPSPAGQMETSLAMQAADQQVAARERWLNAVDEWD